MPIVVEHAPPPSMLGYLAYQAGRGERRDTQAALAAQQAQQKAQLALVARGQDIGLMKDQADFAQRQQAQDQELALKQFDWQQKQQERASIAQSAAQQISADRAQLSAASQNLSQKNDPVAQQDMSLVAAAAKALSDLDANKNIYGAEKLAVRERIMAKLPAHLFEPQQTIKQQLNAEGFTDAKGRLWIRGPDGKPYAPFTPFDQADAKLAQDAADKKAKLISDAQDKAAALQVKKEAAKAARATLGTKLFTDIFQAQVTSLKAAAAGNEMTADKIKAALKEAQRVALEGAQDAMKQYDAMLAGLEPRADGMIDPALRKMHNLDAGRQQRENAYLLGSDIPPATRPGELSGMEAFAGGQETPQAASPVVPAPAPPPQESGFNRATDAITGGLDWLTGGKVGPLLTAPPKPREGGIEDAFAKARETRDPRAVARILAMLQERAARGDQRAAALIEAIRREESFAGIPNP